MSGKKVNYLIVTNILCALLINSSDYTSQKLPPSSKASRLPAPFSSIS